MLALAIPFVGGQNQSFATVSVTNGSFAGAGLSNQFLLSQPEANNDRNLWDKVTFEWTKPRGSNSTMGSLTATMTNSLMQ